MWESRVYDHLLHVNQYVEKFDLTKKESRQLDVAVLQQLASRGDRREDIYLDNYDRTNWLVVDLTGRYMPIVR